MARKSRTRRMIFVFTSRGPYDDMGVDVMTNTWGQPLVIGGLGLGRYFPWSLSFSHGKENITRSPPLEV